MSDSVPHSGSKPDSASVMDHSHLCLATSSSEFVVTMARNIAAIMTDATACLGTGFEPQGTPCIQFHEQVSMIPITSRPNIGCATCLVVSSHETAWQACHSSKHKVGALQTQAQAATPSTAHAGYGFHKSKVKGGSRRMQERPAVRPRVAVHKLCLSSARHLQRVAPKICVAHS